MGAGEIVGGIAGMVASGFNTAATDANNDKQRRWNDRQYQLQRYFAVKDWNMQNEYNSPANQMKRYKAAGLNPNLIYGSGSASAGNATPVRSSEAPAWNPKAPQFDMGAIVQSLGAFAQIAKTQAETNKLKAAEELDRQHKIMSQVQTTGETIKNAYTQFNLDKDTTNLPIYNETKQAELDKIYNEQDKTIAETKGMDQKRELDAIASARDFTSAVENWLTLQVNRAKTDAEKDKIRQEITNLRTDNAMHNLDLELMKTGARPHDSAVSRGIQSILGNSDPNAPSFLEDIKEGIKQIWRSYWGLDPKFSK